MSLVNTVTGPLPATELGMVLPHEHIFVVDENFRSNYLPDWDEAARIDTAVAELNRLKAAGVDTLMDVSVLGLGRNIPRIQQIAARTPMNIVVSTGLFTYNDIPFQFHYNGPGIGIDGREPLVEMFVNDLTAGIGSSGVKAAFLFCVIESEGLTDGVERVMRAVGKASVQTGAPVSVHINPHTDSGAVAQRVLTEEGVDPSRVLLAHSGDSADVDKLMRLADAGSILGLDRFGLDILLPFEQRMATLIALIERGYADRIALSQGASVYSDWFECAEMDRLAPDWDYFQITGRVLPYLRANGIAESVIEMMTVDVPRRFLSGDIQVGRQVGHPTQHSAITGLSPENYG